jgi:putative membrane protein
VLLSSISLDRGGNVFRNVRFSARAVTLFSLMILAIAAGSCGKKEEAATETPPAATSEPAPAALTDANIAAIVLAANTADIKNAEQAKTITKNPAVKAFADQMITDHTAVNKQAGDLAAKLSLTPAENDASTQLTSGSDATRDAMKAQTGAAFDKAYIDNEVTYHQAVLDMLDGKLIPGAQNAELKSLLESVKPAFVAHLDHAKKVQAALAK